MIERMLKYSVLIYHREFGDFLHNLQNLGMMHIVEKEGNVSEKIQDDINFYKKLEQAEKILEQYAPKTSLTSDSSKEVKIEDLVQNIFDISDKKEQLESSLDSLVNQMNKLSPWGNYSQEYLNKVENETGRKFSFFVLPESKFSPELQKIENIFVINTIASQVYFIALMTPEECANFEIESLKRPEISYSEAKVKHSELKDSLKTYQNKLEKLSSTNLSIIRDAKKHQQDNINFRNVVLQAEDRADSKVKVIEGWIPFLEKSKIDDFLLKNDLIFEISDPSEDEIAKVPIKLKNNKFNTIFEPIGKLFSLPNYRELDLTPMFAPFFMLFFGFCLGDAGYGLVIFLIATIAKLKLDKSYKGMLTLVQFLGVSTLVMGFLGGAFFGINLIKQEAWLSQSIRNIFLTPQNLYFLAVIVGIIQILFGMVVRAWNNIRMDGFLYAIGTIGWIILVLGLAGVGSDFILTNFGGYSKETVSNMTFISSLQNISEYFAYAGIALILLFNNPRVNIFKRIGLGLWELYGITGLLGDVLSYMRLYALGLASGILGLVINQLGVDLILNTIPIPGLNYLIFFIFIVLAHTGNLLLSGLGSFVHPMRLTFVEFYKNAGWIGAGTEYKPFKK